MGSSDTIYALSSGSLPSGVAVVRLSGPQAIGVLRTIAGAVPSDRVAALKTLRTTDGTVLDRAIVLMYPGPQSFTGEDCVELHVHGGRAVVTKVLQTLSGFVGLRPAEAGEFTRRAFLNGKLDLVDAEGLADLVSAETEAQRLLALSSAGGSLGELYELWRERIVRGRALIEAEFDFSDEGDVPGSVSDQVWSDMASLERDITEHIAGYSRAEIVRNGFNVVLVGRPNAGKSSLLNALARREVAIVSDEPGTTRDIIEVSLDLNGYKVILSDTAGIRDNVAGVEAIGISRSRARAKTADLLLHVQDLTEGESELVLGLPENIEVLDVFSKGDLTSDSRGLVVSVVSGLGLDRLLTEIGSLAEKATGRSSELAPARLRQVKLLEDVALRLRGAVNGAELSLEVRAEELRLAGVSFGRLSGRIDPEDLFDFIFGQFCIGK